MNEKTMSNFNKTLKIDFEKINKTCLVIYLDGEIDTYNSKFFDQSINNVINAGFFDLIFDCTRLKQVSSIGIASFLVFLKKVRGCSGNIVLVNLNDGVYNVFSLLSLTQIFPITKTINEALDLFYSFHKLNKKTFPMIFNCPFCENRLKVVKSGRFRCPACKTLLSVNSKAEVFLG